MGFRADVGYKNGGLGVHGGRRQPVGPLKGARAGCRSRGRLRRIGCCRASMCATKVAAHAQGAVPAQGRHARQGGMVRAWARGLGAPSPLSGLSGMLD